jgi:hypothetical protein
LDVVERDHERARPGEPLEQLADRPVRAIALVVNARHGRPLGPKRREDSAELVAQLPLRQLQESGVERRQVGVERVDNRRERHLALELGRRSAEHQVAARGSRLAELVEEAGLADPRLA